MAPDEEGGYLDLDVRASDSVAGPFRVDGTATLGYRRENLTVGAMAGLSLIDSDLAWMAGVGLRYKF